MKIKVNIEEKTVSMACKNGQLRPGKGKVDKREKEINFKWKTDNYIFLYKMIIWYWGQKPVYSTLKSTYIL